jgi:hypothetical protein
MVPLLVGSTFIIPSGHSLIVSRTCITGTAKPPMQLRVQRRHLSALRARPCRTNAGTVVVQVVHVPRVLGDVEALDEVHAIEVDVGGELITRLVLHVPTPLHN